MSILLKLATDFIAGLLVVAGLFVPQLADYGQNFGATIATTSLSNTINEFRINVNSSTEAINTELLNVSTTIHAYGTIVSENVPLVVGKGGTGITTVASSGQMFIGNGSGWSIGTITASGTNTHIYTGAGTLKISADPTDVSDIYSWTGPHTFSNAVIVTGTTTLASTTISTTTITSKITVPTPTASTDATTKTYVDTGDATSGWWMQASSTIPAGPIASSSLSGFTATGMLQIFLGYGLSNGASQAGIQFNGDTAAKYGSTVAGGTSCALAAAGSGTFHVSGMINNKSNVEKVGEFLVTKYSGTSTIAITSVACEWSNTSDNITSINVVDFGAASLFGSSGGGFIKVFGRN